MRFGRITSTAAGLLRRRWRRALLGVPWLAAAGFAAAALAGATPSAAAPQNRALSDPAATRQVLGQVDAAIVRVLSYSPTTVAATDQAAHTFLTGTAAAQYQQLFAGIRGQVTSQQLTLTTKVVSSGVVSLTGDRAQLLLFLDQTSQRPGQQADTVTGQLSVAAERHGSGWRITGLTER